VSARDKYYELETASGIAADAVIAAARTMLDGAEERDGGLPGWIVEERDVSVLRRALDRCRDADDALTAENRRASEAVEAFDKLCEHCESNPADRSISKDCPQLPDDPEERASSIGRRICATCSGDCTVCLPDAEHTAVPS
jgi:hypothetical protein